MTGEKITKGTPRVFKNRIGKAAVKQLAAVLVVAIMVAVVFVGAVPTGSDNASGADSADTHTVTYYENNTESKSLAVKYSGIILSEYNPTYWESTVTGAQNTYVNWSGASSSAKYKITSYYHNVKNVKTVNLDGTSVDASSCKYSSNDKSYFFTYSVPMVFCGWKDNDSGLVYAPGELIPSTVTKLYAQWGHPDIWYNFVNGSNWKHTTLNIYTAWDGVSNYGDPVAANGESSSVYTRICELPSSFISLTSDKITTLLSNFSGSIRSSNVGSTVTLILGSTVVSISGDTIIDNVKISGTGGSHGNAATTGLFANGHMLILGTGIETVAYGNNESEALRYPQVFGGSSDSYVTSTEVIIHSGVYSNLVAGAHSYDVTNDTKLMIKCATVLDTVIGGGVYGAVGGSTYIYATKLIAPGDTYEEEALGTSVIPSGVYLQESSIITGGSNNGEVSKNTNVYISGDSEVWDVQAGGRRAPSTVSETANLEISGNALVKHVACGSITDGSSGSFDINYDRQCVNDVKIVVKDTAKVAAVFGAGYDTYYSAIYASMYGSDISVTIAGGTVGYVYGGGYRGTIGNDGVGNSMSIVVNISGGTVLNDVFGGGRGGLDKITHNENGSNGGSGSYQDSTGKAIVYGNITINLTGGTVNGSVYGGGESVAALTGTTGYRSQNFIDLDKIPSNVAAVYGNITINATDANGSTSGTVVSGNIYGAGKGVDVSSPSNDVYLMSEDGTIKEIDWYKGAPDDNYIVTESTYTDYAKVTGTVTVNFSAGSVTDIYGGGQNSAVSSAKTYDTMINVTGGTVNGSVYGGGQYGAVANSTQIIITNVTINGSVYGGGKGANSTGHYAKVGGSTSVTVNSGAVVSGSVYGGGRGVTGIDTSGPVVGSTAVTISNSAVKDSVYGGGAYGTVGGDLTVTLDSGTVTCSVYGGGLGYAGETSTVGQRTVTIENGSAVGGSVYGASSLANDGTEADSSDSVVLIIEGAVGGSVYGGGYKGTTYGSTHLWLGYDTADATEPSGKTVTVTGSVYGGGDIGQASAGSAFTAYLVYGDSEVHIRGQSTAVGHSIFGSGNACLTSGDTAVYITDFTSPSTFESVQRAKIVVIDSSTLTLNGRSDGLSGSATTKYAFNRIDSLTIQNGTVLNTLTMINEIKAFTSAVSEDNPSYAENLGVPTTSGAYSNTLRIYQGDIFVVKYTSGDDTIYGPVSGYTLLTIDGSTPEYGAFAYGAVDSAGGFLIEKETGGVTTHVLANYVDFGTEARCWYIAGTATYTATALLKNSSGATTVSSAVSVTVPVLSADGGKLRYTGAATFAQQLDRLVTVDSMGYLTTLDRYYLLAENNTLNFSDADGFAVCDGTAASAVYATWTGSSQPTYKVTVTGLNPVSTGYVGYVTMYLEEVAESGEVSGGYIATNKIEVNIEIYTESPIGNSTETIYAVDGTGSANVALPRGYYGYGLTLNRVDFGTNVSVPVYLNTASNLEATDGWQTNYAKTQVNTLVDQYLAETRGDRAATLTVTADATVATSFVLYFTLSNGANTYEFTVTVDVIPSVAVTVTVGSNDLTYNGEGQKPALTVKVGDTTIPANAYAVTYTLGDSGRLSSDGLPYYAGKYVVNVVLDHAASGYVGEGTVTFTILPATLTVTTESGSRAYNGTALTAGGAISGFVTIGGVTETAGFAVTGSQLTAGTSNNTYKLTWNGTAVGTNYTVTETVGTLTVTVATDPIKITADSDEKTYDGELLIKNTFTYTGTIFDGDVLTVTVEGSQTNCGYSANTVTAYKVMHGAIDVTDCYTFSTSEDGTLTVNQRDITFTGQSASKTYNAAAQTITEITVAGLVNTHSCSGLTYAATGTYADTYSGVFDGTPVIKDAEGNDVTDNYNVTKTAGVLTITVATVEIPTGADQDYTGYYVQGAPGGLSGYYRTVDGSTAFQGVEVGTYTVEYMLDNSSCV